MTKLAVISDVHADVHALRDVLLQIDRLGIEQVLCCGDLLDYGLFPEETLTLLRERGVHCVRGNHDRWALDDGVSNSWDLSPASLAYLASAATYQRKLIDGIRVVLTHGRPESDMKGIADDAPDHELETLLVEAAADVLIVGHTHVPFVRRLAGNKLVANPGALLRDPAPSVEVATPGTFGVFDGLARTFVVMRAVDGSIVIG